MGNLRKALKKRKAEEPETYIDRDFILATAVDLDRLWSHAKNLMTDKRRGMATVMIQVILFLKRIGSNGMIVWYISPYAIVRRRILIVTAVKGRNKF